MTRQYIHKKCNSYYSDLSAGKKPSPVNIVRREMFRQNLTCETKHNSSGGVAWKFNSNATYDNDGYDNNDDMLEMPQYSNTRRGQTWDLSKFLHDQIFSPEILHKKSA